MKWCLALMCVIATIVAAPGFAVAEPITLAAFLAKKYGKNGGFDKVFNKVFPQQGPTTTPVPFEGRKPDGSYWWGAYFGNGNVVVLSWPHKTLQKACKTSSGSLTRVMPYSLSTGPSAAPVGLADVGGTAGFSVTSAMLRAWSATDAQTSVFREDAPQVFVGPSRNASLVDARGILGVFSCAAGASVPLWHVAILPTPAGDWQGFARGIAQQDSWVMLRIIEVNRDHVERTAASFVTARAKVRMAAEVADQKTKRAQDAEAEQLRMEGPKIVVFQRSVVVGSETNCGIVLGFNGPLVEVQVPADIKLPNGASRVFVKRAALAPVRSRHRCYQYGHLVDTWDVGPVIETGVQR